MRRDLPFQEIVAIDKGIAVINAVDWYAEKIKINLLKDGEIIQKKRYDKKGFCLFDNLLNDTQYTIVISRTDIKGKLLYKTLKVEKTPLSEDSRYIVLVGASVGSAWDFPNLNKRVSLDKKIVTGFRGVYDFDKSKTLDVLCNLPIPVTAVIIKECAAYFPRDINSSHKQIVKWVHQLKNKGIQPILATVVPVTMEHDKVHLDRFKTISSFNELIRKYAREEGIPVLDLEKALRVSEDNRHLVTDYSQKDGLHLLSKPYSDILDEFVLDTIKTLHK
jgi:hypothetical protein